ncbi:MAG: S24 family peptidase [Vibrio sp.]|uniref:LexA family transcriptional regulator n=1 Tax=Vibrio sp. TaxID=678 RepID=UPI003A83EBEF
MSCRESDQGRANDITDPFVGSIKGSITERLIALAGNRTIRETARIWELSTATVSLYTKKGGMPSLDRALTIANNEGVSLLWLATGQDECKETEPTICPITNERIYEMPKYNVAASAGGGAFIDTEVPIEYYPFSHNYLKRHRLLHAELCIIEAHGDSMEPTIESGDDLLLKLIKTESDKPFEGIYVIDFDGKLRVKRLEYSVSRDGYKVISDNAAYSEEFISRSELKSLRVIGEVVLVMGKPSRSMTQSH